MSLLPRLFCLLLVAVSCYGKLTPAYWWKSVDFKYNSDADRQRDLQSGVFNKEHVIPVGMEVWRDTIFVTLPRWKNGVPASLATFNKKDGPDSPKLMPYPNWAAHNLSAGNPERIISPFRVEADACDRLWILDTGVDNIKNISGTFDVLSNPQVIVYDLKTNKRLRTFTVPDDQIDPLKSFFANIALDFVDCDKTWAYLADLAGYLVVYSWADNTSWRVDHESFKIDADPDSVKFEVANVPFEFHDGIFGLALTDLDERKERTMFYHPFSSFKEFKVSTKNLRDERLSREPTAFKLVGERGPRSQANAAAIDYKTGVLLYTQVNHDAIGCWNPHNKNEYKASTQGFLDQDHTTLVFPNDVKVDANGDAWVLSDRMTDFTEKKGPADLSRVNFRILTGNVEKLIADTVCKSGARQTVAQMMLLPVVYLLHKLL